MKRLYCHHLDSFVNKSKTVPVRIIDKTERQESCCIVLCVLSFIFVWVFDKDSATFSGQFEEQKKGTHVIWLWVSCNNEI